MNRKPISHCKSAWIAGTVLLLSATLSSAQQTTAFTYQGRLLVGGTNANGAYTMIFALYDAATNGNQIGSAITNSPTFSNGLFAVNLDFGATVFNGSARWLGITITNAGTSQILSPRVQVLPTPYAQYAASAASAISANGVAAGSVTGTSIAANTITAINIASGQVVRSLNGLADFVTISAGTNITLSTNGQALTIACSDGPVNNFIPNMQVFSSSGNFVVPAGVTRILIEMWGGGGGGGGNNNDSSCGFIDSYLQGGGGGGGGAYSKSVISVASGSSYTVLVGKGGAGGVKNNLNGSGGNGGTSSVGTLITAAGGNGGGNGNDCSGDAPQSGYGGNGGSTSGPLNYLNIAGGNGGSSGGGNVGGAAAVGGPAGQEGTGGSGGSPGGGGSGVYGSDTAMDGGSGANGLVIIYY